MRLEVIVPAERSRFILVHYHIFKNAGSTIESILEREFPERFATVHGRDSETVLDAADLLAFAGQHPKVSAISSHHLRYPKPVDRQCVFFDCCFLRHPLNRLQSCYNHFRRAGVDHPYAAWARTSTSREFIRHLVEEAPHQVSDVQVMQLSSGGAFTRPADEQDLDRATAVVRDMAVPGLVEMFDESLVAGEYFLRPAFPSLRMEYLPRNVSPFGSAAAEQSSEYWTSIWGADLYETLLRMNEFDLELAARTRQEIHRRLELIPKLPEKLMDFKARCARLALADISWQSGKRAATAAWA